MKFLFSWWNNISLEEEFRISARPCNILYIIQNIYCFLLAQIPPLMLKYVLNLIFLKYFFEFMINAASTASNSVYDREK